MIKYENAVGSATLSDAAQLRIFQNVKDELEKRTERPARRIFTKPVIAVLLSAVVLVGVATPIGVVFHDHTASDNSVSGGFIITDNSLPEELSPYFCAYKFDTNIFDPNNVEIEIYLGISESTFAECYSYDMQRIESFGNIIERSIMPTIKKYKSIDAYLRNAYSLENDIGYTDKYIDFLRNTPLLKYDHGLYIWDKIVFDKIENFPFEKYKMNSYKKKDVFIREYSYSKRVTIPEDFFEEESGAICIDLEEYTRYENGELWLRAAVSDLLVGFSYYKKGGKIYVENV